MPRAIASREIKLTHPKRGSRSSRRIFVATEGFISEKKYLKALGDLVKTNVELILISRTSADTGLSAPEYVLQTVLEKKNSIAFRADDTFWMLIDKDEWDITDIEELCETNEINLIISNPCFEIWILFHYIQKDRAKKLAPLENCNSIAEEIREFDTHFSKNRPVIPRTFNGLRKAIDIAKSLDLGSESIYPNNPGSRVYKLLENILD
jgi:hypothetical protein